MVNSFLHKPESVTGTFEERTLTIWTDLELTQGFFEPGRDPAMLERAAEAYTGQKRRVVFKVGKPEPIVQPAPAQASGQPQPEEDKFNDLLALGRQFGNFTVK